MCKAFFSVCFNYKDNVKKKFLGSHIQGVKVIFNRIQYKYSTYIYWFKEGIKLIKLVSPSLIIYILIWASEPSYCNVVCYYHHLQIISCCLFDVFESQLNCDLYLNHMTWIAGSCLVWLYLKYFSLHLRLKSQTWMYKTEYVSASFPLDLWVLVTGCEPEGVVWDLIAPPLPPSRALTVNYMNFSSLQYPVGRATSHNQP